MKIGIIGAGHIGGTLAKLFTAAGHVVEIANSRGPDTLRDLERESGARAVDVETAVRDKDVIVLTIPMKAVPSLPEGLFRNVAPQVSVIDTCNYYPRERDGRIEAIETGLSESQWVSGEIGHPTVKAFNNITYRRLGADGKPKGDPQRIALPVSGDDPAQKRTVMALVDQIGFEPIDNGPLSESWRHQPGTPAYLNNSTVAAVREQLAAASPTRTPQFSAAA